MKTKIFRKVTVFIAVAIFIVGCSMDNEHGTEFKVADDLLVRITNAEFDLLPNEYKGSAQVTIAKGITLEKGRNNDHILIFKTYAAQGTLRIAIKKGNSFYISVFVTSELPTEGSTFLFDGSNISTLRYGFEKDDCNDDEKPFVDQGVHIEGGPGVYIAGSWERPVNVMTKSSSNFTSWNLHDQIFTALMTGNSLHLLSQSENNRIKSSSAGGQFAKLWKDGQMHTLDNQWSEARSVFVTDNGDVYMAGIAATWWGTAAVWKNGKVQNLMPGTPFFTQASSVYVSNGNVYVAGSENHSNNNAILWINGKTHYLTCRTTWTSATSVFVSGNDVYVTGIELPDRNNGISTAVLWKNGQKQNLTDGTIFNSAWALSVFVSGNDVYVTGFEGNSARLWKNGIVQNLNGRASVASSVFVSDGNVYVAGYDVFAENMKVWKNGNVLYKMDGKYYVQSIFVSGSDVYVVANETTFQNTGISTAKLWKNGVLHDISNGSTRSHANSVFVVK